MTTAGELNADAGKRPSLVGAIVGLVVVTIVAILAGFVAVKIIRPEVVADRAQPQPAETLLRPIPLPSILTTLAGEKKVRLRLDLVVMAKDREKPTPRLLAELSDDILSYMRTVQPEQLYGPVGFSNLREDLDDITRARSRGLFDGVLFQSFIMD